MRRYYASGYLAEAIDTETILVTPPAAEPLSLAMVKLQRRVSSTSLDSLFNLWIAGARQTFERETEWQLISATYDHYLDAFPQYIDRCGDLEIELPHPPLQSVTSVQYLDDDGNWQTFADTTTSPDTLSYDVFANAGTPNARRGRIALKANAEWPTPSTQAKAVKIRYVAGFGDSEADVPDQIKGVLLQLVGTSHKIAESVMDFRGSQVTLPEVEAAMRFYRDAGRPQLVPRRWAWRTW